MDTPEAIEFYRWLGICVATWAYIDRRLYQIFHHTIGLEQKQSATKFYADRSFKSRLRLVDRELKNALTLSEFNSEWKPLHDETLGLSYTRNIFAHHPTLRIGTARDGKPCDIYYIRIEPYEQILNKDYPGLRGKTELDVEDLRRHDSEVIKLETKLHDFAWRMGGWRAAQKSRP